MNNFSPLPSSHTGNQSYNFVLHGSRVTQSSWLWAVVLSVYADRGSGKNSRGGDE